MRETAPAGARRVGLVGLLSFQHLPFNRLVWYGPVANGPRRLAGATPLAGCRGELVSRCRVLPGPCCWLYVPL